MTLNQKYSTQTRGCRPKKLGLSHQLLIASNTECGSIHLKNASSPSFFLRRPPKLNDGLTSQVHFEE
jgi:hypothetical protein